MKIAAIDIGSNAARMQISKVLENDGKISFKKVEYVRFALVWGMMYLMMEKSVLNRK